MDNRLSNVPVQFVTIPLKRMFAILEICLLPLALQGHGHISAEAAAELTIRMNSNSSSKAELSRLHLFLLSNTAFTTGSNRFPRVM